MRYYLTFDMLDAANDFVPKYAVVCAMERSIDATRVGQRGGGLSAYLVFQ